MQNQTMPDAHTRVTIAARAGCSPRTVDRYYLDAGRMRSTTAARIRAAIAELGASDKPSPPLHGPNLGGQGAMREGDGQDCIIVHDAARGVKSCTPKGGAQ